MRAFGRFNLKCKSLMSRAATLGLLVVAAIVIPAQAAFAAPIIRHTGPLYNAEALDAGLSRVMAVKNASEANLAPLIAYQYSQSFPNNDRILSEQEGTQNLWRLKPQHTYSYDGNPHNDKCLAIYGNQYGADIPIVNAACTYDGTNNDVWYRNTIYASGIGDTFEYQSVAWPSLCIRTQNASTANGSALVTGRCFPTMDRAGMWRQGDA